MLLLLDYLFYEYTNTPSCPLFLQLLLLYFCHHTHNDTRITSKVNPIISKENSTFSCSTKFSIKRTLHYPFLPIDLWKSCPKIWRIDTRQMPQHGEERVSGNAQDKLLLLAFIRAVESRGYLLLCVSTPVLFTLVLFLLFVGTHSTEKKCFMYAHRFY